MEFPLEETDSPLGSHLHTLRNTAEENFLEAVKCISSLLVLPAATGGCCINTADGVKVQRQ